MRPVLILFFLFCFLVSTRAQKHALLSCEQLSKQVEQKEISVDSAFQYFIDHIKSDYEQSEYQDCRAVFDKLLKFANARLVTEYAFARTFLPFDVNKDSVWQQTIRLHESRSPVDSIELCEAIVAYGELVAKTRGMDASKPFFHKAISLFRPGVINEELPFAHSNLAVIFQREMNYSASLIHSSAAIDHFTSAYGKDHLYVAKAYCTHGVGLLYMNKFDEAIVALEEGVRIHDNIGLGQRHWCGKCLNSLASAYAGAKDQANAMLSFDRSLSIFKKLERPRDVIDVLRSRASAMSLLSDDFTEYEILEALKAVISESLNHVDSFDSKLTVPYNNLGVNYYQSGNYKMAATSYARAFHCKYQESISTDRIDTSLFDNSKVISSDLSLLNNISLNYYRLYEETKDVSYIEKADNIIQFADKVAEHVRSNVVAGASRTRVKNYLNKHYDIAKLIALGRFQFTDEYEYLNELFGLNEKALAWDLAETYLLQSVLGEDFNRNEILLEISQIKSNLRTISSDKSISDSLKLILSTKLDELKVSNPEYFNFLYAPKVESLEKIRQYCQLNNSNWLIYFAYRKNELGLICVTPDTIFAVEEIAHNEDISDALDMFNRYIESRSDSIYSLSARLGEILLSDVKPHLHPGILNITRTPTLANLPFEMLLLDTTESHQYLLYDHPIAYQQSATWFMLSKDEGRRLQSAVAIAPDYNDNDLTFSKKEVGQLSDLGNCKIISRDVSSKLILESVTDFDLLHFAGHTYTHSKSPDSIYLLTGVPKDTLFMKEIINHKSKSQLVVLSSCHSATGIADPEGKIGLAYAFMCAGSPNIIASNWSVSDRETTDIFASFYEHLAAGENSVESLQEAKIDFISNSPLPARHPYFWANFEHAGHAIYYEKQAKIDFKRTMLIGVFLLSILLLILRIRHKFAS